MKKFKDILNEKSLSRTLEHMKNNDTGIITAYRSRKYKVDDKGNEVPEFGDQYTKKENQQRNRKLLALLQSKGYGVISMKGTYIENFKTPEAKEVGEHVFFVIDLKNKGNLKKDLKSYGEKFNQDSIMFIPKGGDTAILIGTNSVDKDAFPGYGKSLDFNTRKLGSAGEFFTKLNNKPFMFESVVVEYNEPDGYLAKMACSKIANSNWSDIEI
jgi:hypothetical protein